IRGQAAMHRSHRVTTRDGRENDSCATEFVEFRCCVFRGAIDVMPRSKLPGERFLVLTSRYTYRPEAHFCRILDGQMAESTEAEHGDDIARPRSAVTKRVVRRDTGTHQRRCFDSRKVFGYYCQRDSGSNHEFGITAVERKAGSL